MTIVERTGEEQVEKDANSSSSHQHGTQTTDEQENPVLTKSATSHSLASLVSLSTDSEQGEQPGGSGVMPGERPPNSTTLTHDHHVGEPSDPSSREVPSACPPLSIVPAGQQVSSPRNWCLYFASSDSDQYRQTPTSIHWAEEFLNGSCLGGLSPFGPNGTRPPIEWAPPPPSDLERQESLA